jgi:hypothetical protein
MLAGLLQYTCESTYLQERAASVVDSFDQTGIRDAYRLRPEAHDCEIQGPKLVFASHALRICKLTVTMLLMKLSLRLNVCLPIVVEEAPEIRELSDEWARQGLEW